MKEVHRESAPSGVLLQHGLSDNITRVKIASTDGEKEGIYRLRYKVYIEEMHGENRHTEADRKSQQLRDEWDENAYHFYVQQGPAIVACARDNPRCHGPLECEDQFAMHRFRPWFPHQVSMTSRLVLHPGLRGNYVLKQLMCAMYEFGRKYNIQYNFIDCHTQLLPLYLRLGYRLYRPGFNHYKYTYVFPMVLVLDDLEHLERVNSPFLPVARKYPHSTKARDLLLSRFPDAGHSTVAVEGTVPSLRDYLLQHSSTVEEFELLEGLTLEEARLLLSHGHIVSSRMGDVILNPGTPGRDVFLILNGSFQIEKRPGACQGEVKVLKLLARGDTFGEIQFLRQEIRQASVKAREDSTLLVLNARFLERLVFTQPKLAAKVFRNVANIVAIRLCDGIRFIRFPRRRTRASFCGYNQ